MQTTFQAIILILISLSSGYMIGKSISRKLTTIVGKFIIPLVWLLLLSIGIEFGYILKDLPTAKETIYLALIYSILSSLGAFLLVFIFYGYNKKFINHSNHKNKISLYEPFKECFIALGMVFIGVLISSMSLVESHLLENSSITDILLYLLIFMVGFDISKIRLDKFFRSRKIIFIPILIVIGSLIGGGISSLIVQERYNISLALSSGFGWFTLSGVLVSTKLGPFYGTVALLTDLFREIISIISLYIYGYRFPLECIGTAGATALDSTLPIIKQTCDPENIPIALISGFLLTLLAPVLITFFLSISLTIG